MLSAYRREISMGKGRGRGRGRGKPPMKLLATFGSSIGSKKELATSPLVTTEGSAKLDPVRTKDRQSDVDRNLAQRTKQVQESMEQYPISQRSRTPAERQIQVQLGNNMASSPNLNGVFAEDELNTTRRSHPKESREELKSMQQQLNEDLNMSNEVQSEQVSGEGKQQKWANLFTKNRLATHGMALNYIPPSIING